VILLDNNQILIASIFQSLKTPELQEKSFLRHLVLNTYRMYRSKFKDEYGDLVICHDSSNCWRKDFFPEYKANRKQKQKADVVDWNGIYNKLHEIREEIRENFPYRNIAVPRTEADDVISVLCHEYSEKENIVIVSNDKDFKQLLSLPNVKQYSPMKKGFIDCEDPSGYLFDHILKGDSSDGVPNILSDSDTFVRKDKRQKRLTKKIIELIEDEIKSSSKPPEFCLENWNRNKLIIDLSMIPNEIKDEIIESYENCKFGDRSSMLNYMIDNRLKNLIENLEDF
jgi:5'-3' exonuclease